MLAVRQDATRFVDTFASPDRYMAVIAYGAESKILQNFTADPARLKNALSLLQNFAVAAPGAAAATNAGGRFPQRTAVPVPDAMGYRHMLASLRAAAGSIAGIRGRKALVLFSGGVNAAVDLSTDVTATIDACNRANVAIYGVSGHGLIGELRIPRAKRALQQLAQSLIQATGANPAGGGAIFGFQKSGGSGGVRGAGAANSSGLDASGAPINSLANGVAANQDVLRELAAGTGGLMLGTSNNLPEELGRLAQEQDQYYLLGYTPAVESAEGTCHTLQVKVARSGLDVRARKSYCTSKPPDPPSGQLAGKDLNALAAGNTAGNIAMQMQLPWFYSGPNVARVSVAADIVPTAVQFRKEDGKLLGQFDLAGIAYNADGSVAARFSDTVKLAFASQKEADTFLATPYHYANQFEIAPGHYDFRLVVNAGDKSFGKAAMPLTIDPWNGEALAMSALALSHDAHAVATPAEGSDDLLLTPNSPLVSNGIEVIPAGTNRFRVGEKGFFYFEVYEPPLRQRQIAVRVRILDRTANQQIDDSGPLNPDRYVRPNDPVIPIAMDLPIVSAGLPAGAYKLEVSVLPGAGQAPIVRTADFDVN